MKFSPCSINDATGGFDIELEGFGRIAHVDPFRSHDPVALRNLICAAPDMLAALKWFIEFCDEHEQWAENELCNGTDESAEAYWLLDARAAIAKAEGRS